MKIKKLYKIKNEDKEAKKAALEATLRFYSAYDMEYENTYLLREVDRNE